MFFFSKKSVIFFKKDNMKYVSIDIETSGLDYTKHQILSIGAIIEDTEKKLSFDEIPKFNIIVPQLEILGNPYALNMNRDLIEKISNCNFYELIKKEDNLFVVEERVAIKFFEFLFLNGLDYPVDLNKRSKTINGIRMPIIGIDTCPIKFNVAGKNFGGFDKLFLERLPLWNTLFKINKRILDPALLYVDWKNDETLPDLSECKKRNSDMSNVSHDALLDAWDVITLLRKFY